MRSEDMDAVTTANFEILKALPKSTAHYADPQNGLGERHDAYDKIATVEAVVTIDRAHYHDGHRWAFDGETVKLSPKDAKVLEKAGHVKVVSAK